MSGAGSSLNITFIASECAPFAKVGGLADVIGSLPQALYALGHSVRVILPHHGSISDNLHRIRPLTHFDMDWNGGMAQVSVSGLEANGVAYYFLRGWPFFSPDEDFIYHLDEGIDIGRYLFFSAAALSLIDQFISSDDWKPDVIHAHDWHTGVVPYLQQHLPLTALLSNTASIFSIHNMQYQGWGAAWHLAQAGLPVVDHPLLAAMGKLDNLLAIGLAYSTMLSTVSPHYAQEIATLDGGYGLDGLIHARSAHLSGIVNGIDIQRWNPARPSDGLAPYTSHNLENRYKNKRELQQIFGLPEGDSLPLFGVAMRLVEQKGPAILFLALSTLLAETDAQCVLLGAGQSQYEQQAKELAQKFPLQMGLHIGFDERKSELIYAGSDMFLMPSLFEPCGLSQLIAMRYGSLPVARSVGGLIDTIPSEAGFFFPDFTPMSLRVAMNQALKIYHERPDEWHKRQARAMALDFSWEKSARQYVDLYRQAKALRIVYA
jgi:starch synthase